MGQDNSGRLGRVVLGRHQLRRVVADGGMGRVYEALDLIGQRHVAIKVLHAEVAQDGIAVARFKREFAVSKQLGSPHVIEVLDFQPTEDGSFALVMEFLYGEELRATLRREGTLRPERLVRILSQLALALDAAHRKQLVHRDLKPENLFLCQSSEGDMVKVLDFGSVRDNASNAKKLTVMGTTIGSPYYMPPEQAQGLETLDGRADVWALAAIAYECSTGQVPFQGVNGPSILLEILTRDPLPPSVLMAGIPLGVDDALLRALRKPVGLRTPSAGELADEVGRAFGLDGTHQHWAVTPERGLGELIAARLGALLAERKRAPSRTSATEAFFGERMALGLSQPPSTDAAAPSPGDELPAAALLAGLGAGRRHWQASVLVAAMALLAGVLLALLFI
jgi:serine/threonine protein kinase